MLFEIAVCINKKRLFTRIFIKISVVFIVMQKICAKSDGKSFVSAKKQSEKR